MLTGWAAKATNPLHWLIYPFGMVDFYRLRPWMHPWAALYTAQVAVATFVWSFRDDSVPLVGAIVLSGVVLGLAWLLWQSNDRFQKTRSRELRPMSSQPIASKSVTGRSSR